MARDIRMDELRKLLWKVHEETLQLLFNRYVFRTLQEIVRANEGLQGPTRGKFSAWSQVVYGVTNGIAVRRLGSDKCGRDDVSLTRFIDLVIRYADLFWENMHNFYPAEADRALDVTRRSGKTGRAAELEACRRLLQHDRDLLVRTARRIVDFADKRLAHHNPMVIKQATFRQLDTAIDAIKMLTEKCERLIYREELDLLARMRDSRLPNGWDEIFLEPWATREVLAQDPPLGERKPPFHPS